MELLFLGRLRSCCPEMQCVSRDLSRPVNLTTARLHFSAFLVPEGLAGPLAGGEGCPVLSPCLAPLPPVLGPDLPRETQHKTLPRPLAGAPPASLFTMPHPRRAHPFPRGPWKHRAAPPLVTLGCGD